MSHVVSQPTLFPELYERWLVPTLFEPWVDDILARVDLSPGDRLLDVACGTGIVARVAEARLGAEGRVVGIDVNPQMLAVARQAAPTIEWRLGNATQLPVDGSEAFDVVVCQQGMQFFPDRQAAAREIRRVLAPRGRAAVATWRPLDEVPFFAALHQVGARHLGSIDDRRHALGEAGALAALLEDAGLRDVSVEVLSRRLAVGDGAMLVRLNASAQVGMSAGGATLTDEERARLVDAIAAESMEVLASFTGSEGVAFEMRTNVAIGRA